MQTKVGKQRVYIDPACDILYSSFYIFGLQQIFGKRKVKFSSKYFEKFGHNNHFFAFVVVESEKVKRIIIDFTDGIEIDKVALAWCDVYGKINLEQSTAYSHKIMNIGPSFGIRIFNLSQTLYYAFSNFLKARKRIENPRRFFSDYKSQYLRPRLRDYEGGKAHQGYIFFMSSLWKKEPKTNRFRANFIEVCSQLPEVIFEGGFAPRTRNDLKGFEDYTTASRISIKDYLKKLKSSVIVFNTPAVKGCHGWKLAEYLCMGKAILSTPLNRHIPVDLENKKNIVFTDGSTDDIRLKVQEMLDDIEHREKLGNNARLYYLSQLSPEETLLKLL